MSRELKFRVWGKTEKEYIRYPFAWLSLFDSPDGLEIEDNEDLVIEQYTGLKDKNGKEIYEGDIVGVPGNEEDDIEAHVFGAVVYDKNKFGVKGESPFAGEDIHFFDIWDGLEVIGNIHENPELLEEEK